MKNVRIKIGFQCCGMTDCPNNLPRPKTINTAIIDRLKWNCPTLTLSETSKVRLSEKPKIDIPDTSSIAPWVAGENIFNKEICPPPQY
tara:strand:+ start:437 stop:700 length:264 start_codon:yes stop_codon:yes gene_type:complete